MMPCKERRVRWLTAVTDEREMDQADDEPAFGWSANVDQRSLTQGLSCDGNENEPSLGWTDMEARYGRYGWLSTSDREDEHDGGEPSLGWQNEGPQGVLHTSRDDREDEHDGGEPDHDNEPDYRRQSPPKGYVHPEVWQLDLLGLPLDPTVLAALLKFIL